jgi:hypothetical protein
MFTQVWKSCSLITCDELQSCKPSNVIEAKNSIDLIVAKIGSMLHRLYGIFQEVEKGTSSESVRKGSNTGSVAPFSSQHKTYIWLAICHAVDYGSYGEQPKL